MLREKEEMQGLVEIREERRGERGGGAGQAVGENILFLHNPLAERT